MIRLHYERRDFYRLRGLEHDGDLPLIGLSTQSRRVQHYPMPRWRAQADFWHTIRLGGFPALNGLQTGDDGEGSVRKRVPVSPLRFCQF